MRRGLDEVWTKLPEVVRIQLEKAGISTRKPESLATLCGSREDLEELVVRLLQERGTPPADSEEFGLFYALMEVSNSGASTIGRHMLQLSIGSASDSCSSYRN